MKGRSQANLSEKSLKGFPSVTHRPPCRISLCSSLLERIVAPQGSLQISCFAHVEKVKK